MAPLPFLPEKEKVRKRRSEERKLISFKRRFNTALEKLENEEIKCDTISSFCKQARISLNTLYNRKVEVDFERLMVILKDNRNTKRRLRRALKSNEEKPVHLKSALRYSIKPERGDYVFACDGRLITDPWCIGTYWGIRVNSGKFVVVDNGNSVIGNDYNYVRVISESTGHYIVNSSRRIERLIRTGETIDFWEVVTLIDKCDYFNPLVQYIKKGVPQDEGDYRIE